LLSGAGTDDYRTQKVLSSPVATHWHSSKQLNHLPYRPIFERILKWEESAAADLRNPQKMHFRQPTLILTGYLAPTNTHMLSPSFLQLPIPHKRANFRQCQAKFTLKIWTEFG
jgi:hypothetical protein